MPTSSNREHTRRTLQVFRGLLGRPRRRKRLPRLNGARSAEREYAARLRGIMESLERTLEPLMLELPSLLESARRDLRLDSTRVDAGEGRRIRDLIDLIRNRVNLSQPALEDLAVQFAQQVSTTQRIQMSEQLVAAFGVDVFREAPQIQAIVEGFVNENVALIKNLPQKTLDEIEGLVTRAVTSGELHGTIAKLIEERIGIGKRRAALIARDQVGKFYGAVTRARQTELGITKFKWRTVRDQRVRDEHKALDGKVFSWDDLPAEGYPGKPINCRCYSEPILEDLLEGL